MGHISQRRAALAVAAACALLSHLAAATSTAPASSAGTACGAGDGSSEACAAAGSQDQGDAALTLLMVAKEMGKAQVETDDSVFEHPKHSHGDPVAPRKPHCVNATTGARANETEGATENETEVEVGEHEAGLLEAGACSTANACSACTNAKYPCYAPYNGGCACWSYSTLSSCQGASGSFCQPPTTCVANCARCSDASTCGTCNAGYMLLGGQCATRPADNASVWLKAHNVYRCMHGVPSVTWSSAAAASAQTYVNTLTSLVHSDCYNEPPPAGPAGENLAMGYALIENSATAWYNEVSCCASLPGCSTGSCSTGHFTAMVWKGVTQIGCASKTTSRIDICRYRSGDTLSGATANMQGYYTQNVLPKVNTVAACITQIEAAR